MPISHATAVGALVGGSISAYAPCFSGDDKLLCVPCESSVKLYSVATGEQVGCLASTPIGSDPDSNTVRSHDGSLAGHTRTVTCVMAHPSNRVQVYTASLDGTMKLWDLYDQTCVATYSIKIGGSEGDAKFDRPPILHMVKGAADLVYLLVDPYMVHSIASTPSNAAQPVASAASSTEKERACRIVLYQLSKQQAFILYKVKDATRLAIDPQLKLLAAISGKILRIYDTLGKKSKSTFKKQMPFNLHTVTFHPSEPYLTLGDEKGHILILYGYQQQPNQKVSANDLVTQTLHWHAHKVGSVIFTQDGHYMLSGGEEGVLVIWQLETGTKQFIPRLQSNITHISMSHDGNTYALSMGDNRIKFVSAVSNRVERVIAGLSYSAPAQSTGGTSYLVTNPSASVSPASSLSTSLTRRMHATDESSRGLSIPFLYSPHHQAWFLSSVAPGALQVFDIYGDKHVADLDLLQRNIISRTDDDSGGSNAPRLESMALSPAGDKMVTTERRSGNIAGGGAGSSIAGSQTSSSANDTIVMKFWDWHAHTSTFVLNTRIDPPHSHSSQHLALSTLLWHPNPAEKMVVSIGKDACFKIWREIKKVSGPNVRKEKNKQKGGADAMDTSDEPEEAYWNCTGVGHYRAYPTSSGAFSSDGSLLAVSYGQVLTLWDPYTLTLKHTLLHPSPSHPIRFVAFLPHTPFVLTTTANAMYVWNLLTLSLWWSYDLRVISYAVHERSESDKGYFAVMVLSPEEADAQPSDRVAEQKKDDESTGRQPFKRRQTHLLLFSVHSPVPLRVWPLRDARLDSMSFSNVAYPGNKAHHTTSAFTSPILFANDPTVERTLKRSHGGDSSSSSNSVGGSSKRVKPTSLVYINYKRQLVRFDDIFDEEPRSKSSGAGATGASVVEQASAAAMARLVEQNEEISLFEQLYGKAHRPTPRGLTPSTQGGSTSVAVPGNANNLASLLGGPSHILPPPSSLFGQIMDGMVRKPVKQVQGSPNTPTTQSNEHNGDHPSDLPDNSAAKVESAEPSDTLQDSALLAADSTSTGGHFAWDSLPQLGALYGGLVRLMHDPTTRIVEDAVAAGPSTIVRDTNNGPSAVDRKRKKVDQHTSHTDDDGMTDVPSVSTKTKKSPKLSPSNGHANGDATPMDIDESTQANANGKSKKTNKTKH